MIRRLIALIAVLLVGAISGSPAVGAQDAGEPTVSVTAGPSTQAGFSGECNDAVVVGQEATSFVLDRTGESEDELTVSYEVSGSATAGVHYEALPGQVTFAAGASSTTVDVQVLVGDSTELVDLRLEVVDGDGYAPGAPSSAGIQFARPRDPSLPPPECGFFIEGGDPIERTVEVGITPERILVMQTFPPAAIEVPVGEFRVEVTGGTLPPGLALGDDGRFTGTATEAGTYEAEVQACRTLPPGTCTTATLLITVRASGPTTSSTPSTSEPLTSNTLPATGVSPTSTAGAGVLLVLVGFTLVALAAQPVARQARARRSVGRDRR
ncbi:hypothetical protein BH24ACT2_BH24ACT2_01100 [soil metagenome]